MPMNEIAEEVDSSFRFEIQAVEGFLQDKVNNLATSIMLSVGFRTRSITWMIPLDAIMSNAVTSLSSLRNTW